RASRLVAGEADGGLGGRYVGRHDAARRRRPDPAAADRARARGDVGLRLITSWNEYIFARVLLNDQGKQTVTVWLSYFLGSSKHTDWGALMAGSTLTAIPVVVFFLLVQRKIA